jgi:hypothetical protein
MKKKDSKKGAGSPMVSGEDQVIHRDDWFADADGRDWAVEAVDLVKRTVQLRMVRPPQQTVPFDRLWRNFTRSGYRALEALSKDSKV